MQAGHLTERITIQRKEGGFDPIGQPLPEDWVDWIYAWANIRHLSGLEAIKAGAETSIVNTSVRIRRRPGRNIHAGLRVIHKDTVYEIKAVLPGQLQYNRHIDMICTTTGTPT